MDRTDSNSSADLQWMRTTLERAFELGLEDEEVDAGEVHSAAGALLESLETGRVRAAELQGHRWSVNVWVKKGLLVGFRTGGVVSPGSGVHIGSGTQVMPSCLIDVGAYLDEGVVMEADVLIGACTQVGKRVHLYTAVKLGGILEPVDAPPVIVEDDVFIGGGCGVYEGTVVRRRAVLAAGVVLTGSTPMYDVVKGNVLRPARNRPLEIPEGAVVVPGTRGLEGEWGAVHGLSIQCHIIIKYRDEGTEAHIALEEGLGQT